MHFLKIIASQCTCLTDTSCFATYKNGIIMFKVPKKQTKQNKKKKKILRIQIRKFLLLGLAEQWYYQNLQYVVVKNPDLLNTKKQNDY